MLESVMLSGMGAVLGLLLAVVTLPVLRSLEIRNMPRLEEASVNIWVLGFTAGIALLTGILCGLAPALQAPASAIASVLREGDRQAGSRRQGRLRAVLVTSEVALAFLLLVAAGLMMRSFRELLNEQRGFETAHRLMFSVSYPESYGENGVGKHFIDRLFEELSAVPEVVASGSVNIRPLQGANPGMGIDSTSRSPDSGAPPWAGWRVISPGYCKVVGLRLLRGRMFDERDKPVWRERGQPEPPRMVMVSERLAKTLFPDEDPIGQKVVLWKAQSNLDAEVVGVVADSLERGLAAPPALTVYLPYGRNALTAEFVLQTRGDPMAIVSTVRAIVARLDPNLPIADVRSFDEVVSRSVSSQRLNSALLTVFSCMALLLASLGIYGVLTYAISRRTSEIGLRMALGANEGDILRTTIAQGMRPVLLGIVLGAVAAFWVSRYLTSLLFGVKPFDAATYGAVAALLLVTALLACYLPGRRAMATDPAITLRME